MLIISTPGGEREFCLWHTRRLWSLWDMISLLAGALYWSIKGLEASREIAKNMANPVLADQGAKEWPDFVIGVRKALEDLDDEFKASELGESQKCAQRLIKSLGDSPDFASAEHALKHFLELLESEAGERCVYCIPKAKSDLTESKSDKWTELAKKFPSARKEAECALNCFNIDENTACVFHLMRAVEHGLRALAKERRVRLPKNKPLEWANWQDILKKLDDEIKTIAEKKPAGPAKDVALDFYKGAVAHIHWFKEKRNGVMHARISFEQHEAASTLVRVREFIQGLSLKLDEASPKPIAWRAWGSV